MSENIIKVKYKPRRDTEENWKTNNPILLEGELAITSDRYNMYKIGDGVSTWTQLEYSSNILVCTKEEYETKNANGEIKSGTIVIITDDNDYANIDIDKELSETSTNLVENQAIAKGLKTNETKDNTVTFISNDSKEVTAYEDINVLTSGEKHSSIFNKISTMFKNIRYLYKILGSTDISTINDGTVTNIVSNLNENKLNKVNVINSTVTTEEGYAADARQLNSSVKGTYANGVANEITALNESLGKLYSSGLYVPELEHATLTDGYIQWNKVGKVVTLHCAIWYTNDGTDSVFTISTPFICKSIRAAGTVNFIANMENFPNVYAVIVIDSQKIGIGYGKNGEVTDITAKESGYALQFTIQYETV